MHLHRLACAAALMAGALSVHASEGVSADEIRIGMVNVQTGPAAGLGKGMRSGAEAVFKQVNAKGGVNGRKIELLVGDDGYEPDKAVDETLERLSVPIRNRERVRCMRGFSVVKGSQAISALQAAAAVGTAGDKCQRATPTGR